MENSVVVPQKLTLNYYLSQQFHFWASRRGLTLLSQLCRDPAVGREPLVRRQGSQVSMRVARGSASWLSSHGRGLGP